MKRIIQSIIVVFGSLCLFVGCGAQSDTDVIIESQIDSVVVDDTFSSEEEDIVSETQTVSESQEKNESQTEQSEDDYLSRRPTESPDGIEYIPYAGRASEIWFDTYVQLIDDGYTSVYADCPRMDIQLEEPATIHFKLTTSSEEGFGAVQICGRYLNKEENQFRQYNSSDFYGMSADEKVYEADLEFEEGIYEIDFITWFSSEFKVEMTVTTGNDLIDVLVLTREDIGFGD